MQLRGVNSPRHEAAPDPLAGAVSQGLVMPTSHIAIPAASSGFVADLAVTPCDAQLAAALDQACQVRAKT